MNTDLLIHQTLHGYSDGHRLLATSYQLSEKAQRILLSLSDRSGDIVSGFNEYLTGYPVPESNFYAFAKTWHAPEMERPGCVWTHTLLLQRDYFQNLTNFHPLRSWFVRPEKGNTFSMYKEPLLYTHPDKENNEFIFPTINGSDVEKFNFLYSTVFNQLYEKVKSVVLLAPNSSEYEDFILSLWCQQWPQLRSRFTFCTGSINGRTIQKHPFVVQVAPYQSYSTYVHKHPNLARIDTRLIEPVESRSTSRKDYKTLRSKKDPLIKFVWHYGARMKPFRKNFGWLARFYNLTHEDSKDIKLSKITEFLAIKFPSPEEMPDLKAVLYGGNTLEETFVRALGDEETLLSELFKTEYAHIFAVKDLHIFERTTKLGKASPQSVSNILRLYGSELGMNPIRDEFFQAAAEVITAEQAYLLSGKDWILLSTLISYNPNLAATPALWMEGNSQRQDVFKLLAKLWYEKASNESIDWKKIVYAILDANTDSFADQLYDMFGEGLIAFMLDWHSQSNRNQQLGERWLHYLKKNQGKVMEWAANVSNSPLTKALAAKVLSPHSQEVLKHGSHPWLDLAEHGIAQVNGEDLVDVAAFLLAIGFMNVDSGAENLVAASYEPIYKAAFSDSIPWRSWSYLDKLAPSEALLFEWDKCRRLEEALISRIKKYHWSDDLLLRAARSPTVFWNIVRTASDSSSGRKLLWRLYEKVVSGSAWASMDQMKVLQSYCIKYT